MKRIFTFLFLLTGIMGTGHAQQLTTLEYFFDTDPGYGLGKQLPVGAAAIDADFSVSLAGLPAGVHTLGVRMQDANHVWSNDWEKVFIVTSGTPGPATITSAEYFFDTDPGPGNGRMVALNSTLLDSSLSFDVTGLAAGVHTIGVRLKENNGTWSWLEQGSFLVFQGMSGADQLQSLQYFIDSTTNSRQVTLKASLLLDTTISIPIPDNNTSQRVLGLRLLNSGGETGNATSAAISLCDLYKPLGDFTITQYGSAYTLRDASQFNAGSKIKWLQDNTILDSAYTINYYFPPANIPGSASVTEITGSGCRVDTVTKSINFAGVEKYAPLVGSYNSDFILNVYGGGLDTSMTIWLQGPKATVYPYSKFTADGRSLSLVFDFHPFPLVRDINNSGNSQYDHYQLHIKYPNGYEYVGPDSLNLLKQINILGCTSYWNYVSELLQGCTGCVHIDYKCPPMNVLDSVQAEPYFATDLTGPDEVRSGTWNDLTFSITNTGTAVGKEIPIFMLVPANYDIDTSQWRVVGNFANLQDSVSIITPYLDTVVNGQHIQYNLVGLLEPWLGPGETKTIPLRIRSQDASESTIYYWADQRLFGSPANIFLDPCLSQKIDLALGFVPLVNAASAVWDWGWSVGSAVTDVEFHALYGDPLHTDAAVGSIALNTAGMLVTLGTAGFGSIAASGAKAEAVSVVKGIASTEASTTLITNALGGTVSGALVLGSNANGGDPCDKLKQNNNQKQKKIRSKKSNDPNSINGNSDYDTTSHYINNNSTQFYTIHFENQATATANAQHIHITDTINGKKLNLSTLTINQFTIGDSIYRLPAYRTSMTADVGIGNRRDMKVRFSASLDTATGIFQADFFSIDTAGHVIPANFVDGFLPPDVDGVAGTASVSFSLYAKNLQTLDTFSNKAFIYFDANAPVPTNTWMNTVDTTAPHSFISSSVNLNDSTVQLNLQESDIGSGVWYKTVFVKSSTDTLFRAVGVVTGNKIILTGSPHQTWLAFTKATDNVGNTEMKDSTADISFSFSSALTLTWLRFTATPQGSTVRLYWATTMETNTDYFDIQRSADGATFTNIGRKAATGIGSGTSNYTYADLAPLQGTSYYRLRQVDKDGKYSYSSLVKVYFGTDLRMAISPNPARNNVNISGVDAFNQVQLVNLQGVVVRQYPKSVTGNYDISGIPAGLYVLKLTGNDRVITEKLVIR